jgi:hypothetical protein
LGTVTFIPNLAKVRCISSYMRLTGSLSGTRKYLHVTAKVVKACSQTVVEGTGLNT